MKRILSVLLAILCAINANAQDMRRVEGVIQDNQGVAIPNATLIIYGSDLTFKVNSDGKFAIDIPAKAFAITAIADGYRSRKIEIDGTYMMFLLKPETSKGITLEKQLLKIDENKKSAEQRVKKHEQPLVEVCSNAIAVSAEDIRRNKRDAQLLDNISYNIRSFKYLEEVSTSDSYAELGNNYLFGRGGKTLNQAKAFLCYNLGAKNGEGECFLLVGNFYETGRAFEFFHIKKNINIALMFYEKAAEMNIPGAKERIKILQQSR